MTKAVVQCNPPCSLEPPTPIAVGPCQGCEPGGAGEPLQILMSDMTATVGEQSVTVCAEVTGGAEPHIFSSGPWPNGATAPDSQSTGCFWITPEAGTAGTHTVTITVTDADSNEASTDITLTINPAP